MKKPIRGRPALPPGERKSGRLDLRATADEVERFSRAADRAGLKLSDWIRDRLRRAADRELRGAE